MLRQDEKSSVDKKDEKSTDKEALNDTQKNIIEGTLKLYLDDITEYKDNEIGLMALKSLLDTMLSEELKNQFVSAGIWDSICLVRNILSHPYPQNRAENYPYFGIPQNPEIVVYKDALGKAAFEPKGLLSLTAKNDDTAPPVTREATVKYITSLIESEIIKFKIKNPQELLSLSMFSSNKTITYLKKDYDGKEIVGLDGNERSKPYRYGRPASCVTMYLKNNTNEITIQNNFTGLSLITIKFENGLPNSFAEKLQKCCKEVIKREPITFTKNIIMHHFCKSEDNYDKYLSVIEDFYFEFFKNINNLSKEFDKLRVFAGLPKRNYEQSNPGVKDLKM